MNYFSKKKITIIGIVIVLLVFVLNLRNIYNSLPSSIKISIKEVIFHKYENLSERNKLIIRFSSLNPFRIIEKKYKRTNPTINNLDNDYNVKFLPETQRGDFNLSLIQIDLKRKYQNKDNTGGLGTYGYFKPFYLEIIDKNLISINKDADFLFIEIEKLLNKKDKKIIFNSIKSNLSVTRVMGTLIFEDNIFISYMLMDNNCQRYKIASAKINFDKLIFEDIFSSNVCGENLRAGRMQIFEHNGSKGLLASIGGEGINKPSDLAQNLDSDIGKIIFINLKDKKKIIYSFGHRNPQGLLVDGNTILSTEHGPYGGDEINKIIFEKNYGWPIASYGSSYPATNKRLKFTREEYLESHSENNFEEPIFSFIPSIGISQIIKIPNNFADKWKNNYLVSSLFGGSLYRIKFDKKFLLIKEYET